MPVFRVHTSDGKFDLPARTPAEAAEAAKNQAPGTQVLKVKELKARA